MGTWGAGIFESDDALDFQDEFIDKLERIIVYYLAGEALTDVAAGEGIGVVVAAADILALWGEHYKAYPHVTAKVVRHWREMSLQQFEADADWDNTQTADGLDARTERRKVIEATFNRLETVAGNEK